MFFGAFTVNFEIWLQVWRPKLSLFRTLSSIVTCLQMNFYTGALFNPFQLQHCCYPQPHTLPLHMLHSVPLLDLMAGAPLLIGADEEKEAGEVTLAAIITSTLASLTVETVGAPPGRTQELRQQQKQEGQHQWPRQIRCQLCSNIGHSAQQCSQLVHHRNQASTNLSFSDASTTNLSLGSPIQVRINMLLQTLSV